GLPLRLGLVIDAEAGRRHGLKALVADRAAAGLAGAVGAALQALSGGLDLLELVLHLLQQRDVLLHLEGLGAAVARVLVEAGELAGGLGGGLLLLTLGVVTDPLEPGALLIEPLAGRGLVHGSPVLLRRRGFPETLPAPVAQVRSRGFSWPRPPRPGGARWPWPRRPPW